MKKEFHACQGDYCGDYLFEVGTMEQWLGRWKHKQGEGVVVYTPDPFEEEIRGKEVMRWLCEYCWYGSHDEI